MNAVLEFLGSSRYAPLTSCLASDPIVTNLMAGSELVTGSAFYVIAFVLYMIYREKARLIQASLTMLQDSVLLKLLAMTLTLDGLTHYVSLITVFSGIYYLQVILKTASSGFAFFMAVQILIAVFKVKRQQSAINEAGDVLDYAPQLTHLPPPDEERLKARRGGGHDGNAQPLSR